MFEWFASGALWAQGRLFVVCVVLLSGVLSVRAQEPAAITETPTAMPNATTGVPEKIQLGSIVENAEAQRQKLNKLLKAKVPIFLTELEEALPETHAEINLLRSRLVAANGRSTAASRISSIDEGLDVVRRRIAGWQSQLAEYGNSLDGSLSQTSIEKDKWAAIQIAATEAKAPDSVLDQINSTFRLFDRVSTALKERRDHALKEQGDLASESRRIGRAMDQLDELRESLRASLLQPDSQPIWSAFSEGESSERLKADISAFIEEHQEANQAYLARRIPRFIAGFVLGLGIFGFLVLSSWRHDSKLSGDDRFETASRILKRPFSVAALLTLFLLPIILRDPSETINRLISMVVIIPLLRLIPSVIVERFKTLAFIVVVGYLAARAAYVPPEGAILSRVGHMVLETALFFGFWLAGVRKCLKGTLSYGFLKLGCWLGMLVCAGSVVANAFGFSVLSTVLFQNLMQSAYLTLGLLILHRAGMGLFRVLFLLGPLRRLKSVSMHYLLLERRTGSLLGLFFCVVWLFYILGVLDLRIAFVAGLAEVLSHPWHLGTLVLTLGDIVLFVLSILGSVYVSRLVRFFLEYDILAYMRLSQGVPSTILMMVHYGIITLGVLAACAMAGIELKQISIMVGAFGVGVGFGLQTFVNNFVSGLILMFERPINIGDTVQFGTTTGKVQRIGMRSSTVRSFEGAEIIVPNSNLVSGEVINWTLSDRMRRIDIQVGVAYGSKPEEVIILLTGAAAGTLGVEREPKPWASFDGFGDSALNFTVRCWTAEYDNWVKVKSAVGVSISQAMEQAHIEFPFPQHDLHLRSISPEVAQKLGRAQDSGLS